MKSRPPRLVHVHEIKGLYGDRITVPVFLIMSTTGRPPVIDKSFSSRLFQYFLQKPTLLHDNKSKFIAYI